MASHIGRRKFLAMLGGAVAWPLAARAQQSAMPVIELLSSASAESYVDVLKHFNRESGYVDGHNLAIHEQARMAPTCRYDWSFRR